MELLPGCRQQIGAVTLMGELHYIQKNTHINQYYSHFLPACCVSCCFNIIEGNEGGLGGWSCCLVDSSSGAISGTRNLDVTRSTEGRVMATAMMAALMVRARRAVGLGEGGRMWVVLLLKLSKGRRYGVVGAAVRHGD